MHYIFKLLQRTSKIKPYTGVLKSLHKLSKIDSGHKLACNDESDVFLYLNSFGVQMPNFQIKLININEYKILHKIKSFQKKKSSFL